MKDNDQKNIFEENEKGPELKAELVENKKLILGLFVVFSLIAVLVIAGNGIRYEMASRLGNEYLIKIEGYDPYNPIKGRYLMFTPELSRVRSSIDLELGESAVCYLSIAKDESGYYFDKATLDKPEGDYVQTIVHDNYSGGYWYEPPFREYYLPEEIASKAEQILFKNFDKAYVAVRIYNGIGVVDGMYIDDVRLEDMIK